MEIFQNVKARLKLAKDATSDGGKKLTRTEKLEIAEYVLTSVLALLPGMYVIEEDENKAIA